MPSSTVCTGANNLPCALQRGFFPLGMTFRVSACSSCGGPWGKSCVEAMGEILCIPPSKLLRRSYSKTQGGFESLPNTPALFCKLGNSNRSAGAATEAVPTNSGAVGTVGARCFRPRPRLSVYSSLSESWSRQFFGPGRGFCDHNVQQAGEHNVQQAGEHTVLWVQTQRGPNVVQPGVPVGCGKGPK